MMMSDEPRFEVEIQYTKNRILQLFPYILTYLNFPWVLFSCMLAISLILLISLIILKNFFLHSMLRNLMISFFVFSFMGAFWQIYFFRLPFQAFCRAKILVFNENSITISFINGTESEKVDWSAFSALQQTNKFWVLKKSSISNIYSDTYLLIDKLLPSDHFGFKLALSNVYIPTDQLPPEAQAFILQKLTEHNVPIIG
jgi:hypothetical protein